jgi:hypothetical protein
MMTYRDFSVPVIASVIKLSKALAEVPRKVERGLRRGWVRFHPDDDTPTRDFSVSVIAGVIKLSKALAQVPRKVERGLASPRRMGGKLGEIHPGHGI